MAKCGNLEMIEPMINSLPGFNIKDWLAKGADKELLGQLKKQLEI